ncbi:MAG TPA: LysR family transcriptional regulator [Nocardioides sp.]|uniref:LysR family transcriptional regulator n=1 Tax=Nocardioides sp. TaxID=35761 RepID=UPI002C939DC0|nr:LysR family transcriptional regulator [Nocardioides sp.]HTW15596.1 LysR family transcriptional regulator [Nocardioides sp.]
MSDEEQGADGSGLDRLASVNLNLLVPLLALLEERSVTRAAERVGLTQPAMSHALGRMRRLLGDDIVVRDGSRVRLTPRALELIGPLRAVLQQTARVVNFPGFDPARDKRVVTVAMMTPTAFVIGPALARLVAQRAPHATLRIRTITMPTDAAFTDEGVDVVLLSDAFASPYPRERLYDDRWAVIASPDAPRSADALELITGLPHVVFDAERRVVPYSVLDEHRVDYRIGQLVSDNLMVAHLVARSSGVVGFQRLRVASGMRPASDLRIEEFPFPLPGVGIDLVWNPHLSDQVFIEWLRGLLFEAAASL